MNKKQKKNGRKFHGDEIISDRKKIQSHRIYVCVRESERERGKY